MKYSILLAAVFFSLGASCQNLQKVVFEASDSLSGYYLAMPPSSGNIKGVLVVFCPYRAPESILPETKLHNVAAANDLLTVFASFEFVFGNWCQMILPEEIQVNNLFKHLKFRSHGRNRKYYLLSG